MRQRMKKFLLLALVAFLLVILSIIPLRLTIASHIAPKPQAIFTLGGGWGREKFTAQFAQIHPNLDIWVSSGISKKQARKIFRAASIPDKRLHLDYRAVDTVTNFTSLVKEFQKRNIHHLYLITSDFHMARSKAIATFVLGSQGIAFTPVPIADKGYRESQLRIIRDSGRAILWIFTGHTGASLNPYKDLRNRNRMRSGQSPVKR